DILGQLVLTQDDGDAGIQLVGALHALAHVAGIAEVGRQPGTAGFVGETHRFALPFLSDRHQSERPARLRLLLEQHHAALDAAGPTDARSFRPAHDADQAVIAAAAHHGALGPEIGGDDLEAGVAVIVQPAHQARIDRVRNADGV